MNKALILVFLLAAASAQDIQLSDGTDYFDVEFLDLPDECQKLDDKL